MEEEIKQCSTRKSKALKELVVVTKDRDSCQIDIRDLRKQFVIRNK